MTVRLELPANLDGGKEPTGGGAPGPPGPGLPVGGVAGDAPVKTSGTNYATAWTNVATQAELDAAASGLTLVIGEVANELADLVAALGDPDQIAWGAAWDAAGEASGAPAGIVWSTLFGLVGQVSDIGDRLVTAETTIALQQIALAQTRHISFDIDAATMTPLGADDFDTVTLLADAFGGAVRTSDGNVDDSVVFGLAANMITEGGAPGWMFTLTHFTGPDCGIYSIETTADFGATWDVAGTVDGYDAVGAAKQDVISGVTVPDECDQIRVRMGAKNGSSSSFVGNISALSGYFVFT